MADPTNPSDANSTPRADSLIEYPSPFPIKIMGQCRDDFAQTILAVVQKHDPGFVAASMEMRASSGGKYISLTCTVTATSRPMLDALYMELSSHPMVKVVL
jgi:uncharacterized protein